MLSTARESCPALAFPLAAARGAALAFLCACAGERSVEEDRAGSATGIAPMGTDAGEDSGDPSPRFDLGPGAGTGTGQGASGEGGGGEACVGVRTEAKPTELPSDIIVVLDNSESMSIEEKWVQQALGTGIGGSRGLSETLFDSGVDFHLVLITRGYHPAFGGICMRPPLGSGTCPDDSVEPQYLHVDQYIRSWDAFDKTLETYPQWQHSMRADSVKHLMVITDDDSGMPGAEFDAELRALDPSFENYRFHGIFAFSDRQDDCSGSDDPCCSFAARAGTEYANLVEEREGVAGNLCEQDFAPVFEEVAEKVVATVQLPCAWDIPEPPPGEQIDPSRVNVVGVADGEELGLGYVESLEQCPADGTFAWTFDDPAAPTRVLLCPQTCDEVHAATEATVEIELGCRTIPAG